MPYYATSITPAQFLDRDTGDFLSGGSLEAYFAGTTTAAEMFIDENGTSAGTSVTLNAYGNPEVSGNPVVIWLETGKKYKFILRSSDPEQYWTLDNMTMEVRFASADFYDFSTLVEGSGSKDVVASITSGSYNPSVDDVVRVIEIDTSATTNATSQWRCESVTGSLPSGYTNGQIGANNKLYVQIGGSGSNYAIFFEVATLASAINRNLLRGNFRVNQLRYAEDGTNIVLSADDYAHDGYIAGSSGCIYSVSGSTATIVSGSLVQVIDGRDIIESGTYMISYNGTSTVKVNNGLANNSGQTYNLTAGANTKIEFLPGTLSLPNFKYESIATGNDNRSFDEELTLCQSLIQKSYNYAVAPGADDVQGMVLQNSSGTAVLQLGTRFEKRMLGTPDITLYASHGGDEGEMTREFSSANNLTAAIWHKSETGFYAQASSRIDNHRYSFHFVAKYHPSYP